MRCYSYTIYFIMFVLTQNLNSKSFASDEFGNDRENFNSKTDNDQLGIDETVGIHESYRPRHKYKAGTGHQEVSKRFTRNNDDIQESKGPQCAVMYKNNEPVGILQPFDESYKFLPINGEATLVDINPIPTKRKTITDIIYPNKIEDDYEDQKTDERAAFSDDRYPSIFAKFKIDSRLETAHGTDFQIKRAMFKRQLAKSHLDNRPVSSLNSALSKSDDTLAVEEELRNILDDMGLIDDYPDRNVKRQVEDENLELGTNQINLIKEEHTDLGITKSLPQKPEFEKGFAGESETLDSINSDDSVNVQHESVNADLGLEQLGTENSILVGKRQNKLTAQNEEVDKNTDKKKRDLGASDEMPTLQCTPINLVEKKEIDVYEKRVGREIRDKIQKLKEEVKKEIAELKLSNSNEIPSSWEDAKRKKRQIVNTLVDEETKDIDPTFNDEEKEKPLVRRKRSSNPESTRSAQTINNHELTKIVGLNRILEQVNKTVNSTKYHTRSLKQLDNELFQSGSTAHKDGNIGKAFKENEPRVRTKRETGDATDENFYQDDEPDFIEDAVSEGTINGNGEPGNPLEMIGIVKGNCDCDKNGNNCKCGNNQISEELPPGNQLEMSGVAKGNCDCDKNGNNCKCGNNQLSEELPSDTMEMSEFASNRGKNCNCDRNGNCKCGSSHITEDSLTNFPDFNMNPSVFEKKSLKHHCDCDENNNNCKCDDESTNSPAGWKQVDSDYDQSMNVENANLIDDDSTYESGSNSNFNKPRFKTNKRHILNPFDEVAYVPNEDVNSVAQDEYDNYETGESSVSKRETKLSANKPFQNGEYFVDLHPNVYRLSPADTFREKRQNFEKLVAIHGGEPVRRHLIAIKQRSMLPHSRFRRRVQADENNNELRQLIDMSAEDLFGALPRSYDGELSRFKRVKRAKTRK